MSEEPLLPGTLHSPPAPYMPEVLYTTLIQERDVMVPMRDGVRLCADVYRPETEQKVPCLLAIAPHNKDLQGPDLADSMAPQPAWSPVWFGGCEAGDTKYLVSRGYAHVVGQPRGFGKSEDGGSPQWDLYDLIEWIAAQPWCDGNVGMIGLSAFAGSQWQAAALQPPHLKAIFPYDALAAYRFADRHPGGMLNLITYLLEIFSVAHGGHSKPGELPPEREDLWRAAMGNADYKMYANMYNILTQKGQIAPVVFDMLIDPYEREDGVRQAEETFKRIKVPAYTGAGWHAYTYKSHLQGAQSWFRNIDVPKKLMFTGQAHLERPFHSFHDEILRWHDYWLKGIDTGIMDEPPVKIWVQGAEAWRYGNDWPLPETKWTKYYLHSWERLRREPFVPMSRDADDEPDAFVQMPPTKTRTIQKLRYMTDPLPEDTLVIGPISLTLYASIDQEDTNWIAILKDVGPDVSVRTGREGERDVPADLPERELTRGWLKASNRALDEERSTPWKPFHKLTRQAAQKTVPGEVNEYQIEILSTANLFRKGHRICIDITSMDLPTGAGLGHNIEYIPYHICSSKTTLHKIYHDERRPSHLLLPIIPVE